MSNLSNQRSTGIDSGPIQHSCSKVGGRIGSIRVYRENLRHSPPEAKSQQNYLGRYGSLEQPRDFRDKDFEEPL